jgi:hypothetical protein
MESFRKELEKLINSHSLENDSDTPDFLLATYMVSCLENYNEITQAREKWYGREKIEINLPDA